MILCDIFNQCISSFVTLDCTHQYIDYRKEKSFPCTKLSMRNGRCENRLCARASRAWQGSCRIW